MPHFNNCDFGILANDGSTIRFKNNPVHIKDASIVGIQLNDNSLFRALGVSGTSGSSLKITNCERGIQAESARFDIKNAKIIDTKFGILCADASTFNYDNSIIDGGIYGSRTHAAFGIYITDATRGSVYDTTVSGYTGPTMGTTSSNIAVVASSILFAGNTTQAAGVNLMAAGSGLVGNVIVNTNLGKPSMFYGGSSYSYNNFPSLEDPQ